jgi:hypothetical protein
MPYIPKKDFLSIFVQIYPRRLFLLDKRRNMVYNGNKVKLSFAAMKEVLI